MEDERTKQELFDGEHYDDWKFAMEIILDEKELLYLTKKSFDEVTERYQQPEGNETAAQRKEREAKLKEIISQDKTTKRVIVNRVKRELYDILKGKEHAYDVWRALADRYESTTMASVMTLLTKYQNIKYRPQQETFRSFCITFDSYVRDLDLHDEKISEKSQMTRFMSAMPEEYNSVITSMRAVATTNALTMILLRQNIEEFEDSRPKRSKHNNFQPSAFYGGRGQS